MKGNDGGLGVVGKNAVDRDDLGDRGIISRNAIEAHLDLSDVGTRRAEAERHLGQRGGNAAHGRISYQLDVIAVIIGKNFKGSSAVLRKLLAPPLGKTCAGDLNAVAVGGKERFNVTLTSDIVIEKLVCDGSDVFVNIAPLDKGLIDRGGVCDVKGIAARAVIFGVNAVERIGDLCVHIGANGAFVPGGIDLARGHVGDVVSEGKCDIFGVCLGSAEMNGYRFGNIGNKRWHGVSFQSVAASLSVYCLPKGSKASGVPFLDTGIISAG